MCHVAITPFDEEEMVHILPISKVGGVVLVKSDLCEVLTIQPDFILIGTESFRRCWG